MTKELLGSLELNRIYQRDCLGVGGMALIPDKSIDMILCDLPYGTTACKWDSIIPFEPLWEQYERIIKEGGAIVLTSSQPFTTKLINSNIDLFKYCWVWNKKKGGNIFNAKYQPMKIHEDICVFGKGTIKYNPQMVKRDKVKKSKNYGTGEAFGGDKTPESKTYIYTHTYPKSIIEFSNAVQKGKVHPTQKPVPLFEYLIKTYTEENNVVLDNCMGSGTTAVACVRTNRRFIGFETQPEYIEIANKRLDNEEESS
ncbi:DNA-methyltransferase [Robertmurraya andreesenii]|uniref:Methyltransferase n=1 Tax=Anoxybacillus andreesenii TaxID=1325932 RepID=A0ABT9V1Y3_9BACL|nr:site-specific DNA-methyltransferase [Robertmurraya andreesenii]MDQ0154960.1 site-specific DNA-methyltransferase (adenine-specific) [Robertmurraya andreesenii]